MLSQLLSSKQKTSVINLFLAHPGRSFSFTELRADSKCPQKLLKQTLRELNKIDFLITTAKNGVKYHQMNRHFPLYPELVNLLRKVKKIPQDHLSNELQKLVQCKLIALTGVFVGRPRIETDLLFVGKLNHRRLTKVLALAEKYAEQEINYTVLTTEEFEYRKSLNDRFIKNIIENNPVLALDKIKSRSLHKIIYKL